MMERGESNPQLRLAKALRRCCAFLLVPRFGRSRLGAERWGAGGVRGLYVRGTLRQAIREP